MIMPPRISPPFGFHVMNIENPSTGWQISVVCKWRATACPHCGKPLHPHGAKPQSFADVPYNKEAVRLVLVRLRYKCFGCGRTLFEPLPGIDTKRRMTLRALRYAKRKGAKYSLVRVGGMLGVTPKTIRLILNDDQQCCPREGRGYGLTEVSAKLVSRPPAGGVFGGLVHEPG